MKRIGRSFQHYLLDIGFGLFCSLSRSSRSASVIIITVSAEPISYEAAEGSTEGP